MKSEKYVKKMKDIDGVGSPKPSYGEKLKIKDFMLFFKPQNKVKINSILFHPYNKYGRVIEITNRGLKLKFATCPLEYMGYLEGLEIILQQSNLPLGNKVRIAQPFEIRAMFFSQIKLILRKIGRRKGY